VSKARSREDADRASSSNPKAQPAGDDDASVFNASSSCGETDGEGPADGDMNEFPLPEVPDIGVRCLEKCLCWSLMCSLHVAVRFV